MPHPQSMTPDQAQATFVLLKPDAIERGIMGKIITRIEDGYLRISGLQQRRKSQAWVRAHYKHITDPEIFEPLVPFMTATALVGFVVSGPYAVDRMRKMIGSTNSTEAAAGTIRGDFGNYPIMYNCVHASDSPEVASVEWTLFYDSELDWNDDEVHQS